MGRAYCFIAAVIVLAVLGMLGGCGGGDDKSSAVGTAATGPQIVFQTGSTTVSRMNPDGSGLVNLRAGSTPSWNPGRTRIAFAALTPTTERKVSTPAIFTMNADGTGVVQVTTPVKEGSYWTYDQYPAWSPDGTEIVFTRCASANQNFGERIEIVNAAGGTPRLCLDLRGDTYPYMPNAFYPKWSGNGYIAFSQGRSGALSDLQIVRPDGTERKVLVDPATHPAWGAGGLQVAYARQDSGSVGIWVADFDPVTATVSNATRITTGGLRPAWSPDFASIAFAQMVSSYWDIFKVAAGGGTVTNLTKTTRKHEASPDW